MIVARTARTICALLGTAVLALQTASCAPARRESAVAPSPAAATSFFAELGGRWTGTLEYADYRTEARVRLPVVLEVSPSADGASADFAYTYDDGPGKVVHDRDALHFDAAKHVAVIGRETYELDGAPPSSATAPFTWVLRGRIPENDQPTDARETWRFDGESLSIVQETRAPLRFRHAYTLRRAGARGG